jgi:hypothetical protein
MQVRRRRTFENRQDIKKRKMKERGLFKCAPGLASMQSAYTAGVWQSHAPVPVPDSVRYGYAGRQMNELQVHRANPLPL